MEDIFQVSVEEFDGVPVVRAAGEIDVSTSQGLREHLDALSDETALVVIDLSDVTFLDSTGLGVLVSAHKRLRDSPAQGSVHLVVTRPQISKVLEVTGLHLVFPIFQSIAAASAK